MNEGEDSTNLPNMYTTQVVVSGVDEMDLSDACMHRRLGLAERERAFSFNKNLKTCKSPLPPTLHRGNPCQKHL